MRKIKIFDSTLRDGSHAIKHQFTEKNIRDYCRGIDKAGVDTVIVGHGNGLGASSLHIGKSLLTDREMLETAREELKNTKLGAFMIPGFATIENDLKPAIDIGIDVVMVASHCTEANITRQHIQYALSRGIEVYGVLMMAHRVSSILLRKEFTKMQDYGAKGVLLMDSAGAIMSFESFAKCRLIACQDNIDIPVGFHAHNNLGMAVASSLAAVNGGADFIDATSKGLGAGVGNCQLETIVAVLHKLDYETGVDVKVLCDVADNVTSKIMKEHNHIQEITRASLASGIAGIFSGFKDHVIKAANEYKVDVWDIFMELGKKGAVAGQEDLIVEVARGLSERK